MTFLPEGTTPLVGDDSQRSLLKITELYASYSGGGGTPNNARVTDDGGVRVTDDGGTRIVEP